MKEDNIERFREKVRSSGVLILGSTGCQPVSVSSLPTEFVASKLPATAGKLPALPRAHSHRRAKSRREILRVLRVLRG